MSVEYHKTIRVRLTCPMCEQWRTFDTGVDVRAPEDERKLAVKSARAFMAWCDECVKKDADELADTKAKRERSQRLDRSGLPYELRVPLSALEPRHGQGEALMAANAWADVGGALYLHGDVGRGKTAIAGAAAFTATRKRSVRFTTAPELLMALGADFGSPRYREALDLIESRHALVLDDLGQGEAPASDQVRRALHAAINARILAGVPLFITSNKLPSELGRLYGEWLPSRMQFFTRIPVEGPDHRLS